MIGQYLLFKSYRNLRMVLITLIFFMIVMTIDEFREQQKTELIATNDRNNPKIWIKNKMSIIQLVGDSSLMYSNYAEKYNLTDDHLIRIDTSTIRYESDSLFVSSNQISNHGQVYHWITKRTDTLSVPSVQHLIFLPKYWKNKIENKFYPASLYTISSNNEAFIKNIFPQSQIIKSKHNYVQLSMQ